MSTQEPPAELGPAALDDLSAVRAHPDEEVWEPPWKGVFLRGFRAMDNVTSAAKLAGITPQRAYQARDEDESFRDAWADAKEQATDGLEVFAHRMASTGLEVTETRRTVKKQLMPVPSENQSDPPRLALVVVEETEVAITNRMVSPSMAMFLLSAARPEKYSRRARFEHSGPGGGPVPVQHEIWRPVDPVRALELARLTLELGPGAPTEHPDIEGGGGS